MPRAFSDNRTLADLIMLFGRRRDYNKGNLGLFTLPMPEPEWETKYGKPTVDIVAVHGLNGDCFRSWTHQDESQAGVKTTWLNELLPYQLPNARVMTFGYSANVLGNTSITGIRENARILLNCLRDKREDDGEKKHPIVFLGHSLGGIIIKQALRFANNEPRYSDIAESTRGIVFFGTPHRGSDAATWGNLVAGIMATAFGTRIKTSFLKALKPNSRDLMDLSEDFRSIATRYSIASFVEEDKHSKLGRVIVERHSAVMEVPHEEVASLPGDHSNICKFGRNDAHRFDAVWRCIRRIAQGAHTAAPPPGTVEIREIRIIATQDSRRPGKEIS
ncbi:Alpha/Beta hydrolase protein [Lasiosphaeris hirsuta]|uniref:Alpha/Beta hydrolase protein n=1 Tax=Lasiosphaeris hirsuta TaxID=260670 RepID=A0AA40EBQ8_9PEZI|nr:Alpha/Beta hydrolase protein [Lasiosphaeris hirsuta]